MTQTIDPVKSSGHVPRSVSVEDLLRRHRSDAPVTSGALIDELLGTHSYYLGDELTPEPVTMLALSPAADRVAVLAGGTVYELVRGSVPRRVNDVDGKVVSIGWGRDGIIALRMAGDTAEITRIATRSGRGAVTGVMGGRLGSAGLPAWLEQSQGVIRSWSHGNPQ